MHVIQNLISHKSVSTGPQMTPPRAKLGSGAPKAGFVGLEVTLDHPHRVAKVAP